MIGGDFLLDKNIFNLKKKNNLLKTSFENSYLFNSGRSSISFIIIFLKKKFNVKKAYIPYFCCDTIKKTFKYHKLEIEYYSSNLINKQKYFFSKNSVVFFINYFGHENINFKKNIKKKNFFIIEDSVQCCLSNKYLKKNNFDFQIFSFRKFLPVLDGSLLISKFKIINNNQKINVKQLITSFISKVFKSSKLVPDQIFLKIHKESEKQFEPSKHIYVMSSLSKFIFNRLDIIRYNKIRVKNWLTLKNFFNDSYVKNNFTILFKKLKKNDIPLGFPVLLNFKREKFINY